MAVSRHTKLFSKCDNPAFLALASEAEAVRRLCTQRSQRVLWARGLLAAGLAGTSELQQGSGPLLKKKTQLGQTAELRRGWRKKKEAETMKEEAKKKSLCFFFRLWAYIHKAKLRERGKAITARRGTTTAAAASAASASVGLLLGSWRRENAASRLTNLSFLERVIEWWCTIRKQPAWFLKGLRWPLPEKQQQQKSQKAEAEALSQIIYREVVQIVRSIWRLQCYDIRRNFRGSIWKRRPGSCFSGLCSSPFFRSWV